MTEKTCGKNYFVRDCASCIYGRTETVDGRVQFYCVISDCPYNRCDYCLLRKLCKGE